MLIALTKATLIFVLGHIAFVAVVAMLVTVG